MNNNIKSELMVKVRRSHASTNLFELAMFVKWVKTNYGDHEVNTDSVTLIEKYWGAFVQAKAEAQESKILSELNNTVFDNEPLRKPSWGNKNY